MAVLPLLGLLALGASGVKVWSVPAGEQRSTTFEVSVEGQRPGVYVARVPSGDPVRRQALVSYLDHDSIGESPTDETAFASWEMERPVRVTVTVPKGFRTVRVLPTQAGIRPTLSAPTASGRTMSFTVKSPRSLVVEVDGDIGHSLQLFANPVERNAPKPSDPGVVYFGPGIHEIGHLEVKDGGTVYLAPGAVVRSVVKPDEVGYPIERDRRGYPPALDLKGKGITVRGRGILDGSLLPVHARHLVHVMGQDVTLEGIILRDAPVWNVPVRRSDRVTIRNVKVFGYRANSDGFDLVSSHDVTVEDCYLRTFDDLIVVKADKGQGESSGIRVRRCVLWNELAHALSLGAEIQEPIHDVRFEDCDVIHDQGREWTLRIFQTDSARIRDIRFDRIRVEESRKLASVWIGKSGWTKDPERGHISDVLFRQITVGSASPAIELVGVDAAHAVDGVTFDRVRLGGAPLTRAGVTANAFASGTIVRP